MKKKLLNLIALGTAAIMLLSSCNGTTPSSSDGSSARTDLVFGLIGEPKTMDPSEVSDLVSFSVYFQIYDYLILFDAEDNLVPSLAESWVYNDDGTELTFTLREDVTFWDGTPMTADDVVFSFNKAIGSSYTSSYTNMMDRMEKVDDHTVTLYLDFPYGPIEYCVSAPQMGIVSKAHYESVGAEGYARNPMGTGPYQYIEWASGDSLTLKAYENYWGGPAAITDITFKIITDGSTAVIALQNGEVDLIDTPPKADRQTLLDDDNIEYYETEIAASVFVAMNNVEGNLFSDSRIRKAVMHAVDKDEMVLGAVEGLGTPLNTWWPTAIGGWDASVEFEGIPYDVDAAKALLTEAGYPDGFTITLLTTDSATYSKPTEVFQEQLRRIGITANIEKLERSTFFDRVQSSRDYDICVLASTTSVPDVDYIYAVFHSSSIDEGRNYMNVNNPTLDRLLEEGRAETDQSKRYEIYREVAELWNEEVFSGCLYTYLTPIAANKDLKGITINSKNRMFLYDFYWQ